MAPNRLSRSGLTIAAEAVGVGVRKIIELVAVDIQHAENVAVMHQTSERRSPTSTPNCRRCVPEIHRRPGRSQFPALNMHGRKRPCRKRSACRRAGPEWPEHELAALCKIKSDPEETERFFQNRGDIGEIRDEIRSRPRSAPRSAARSQHRSSDVRAVVVNTTLSAITFKFSL